ncbi:MAG: class 1 fructose-bisphosphatase [Myxococcota bacterium]
MPEARPVPANLDTLDTHLSAARDLPTGLAGILSAIALAGKAIAEKVRRARIEDVLGDVGGVNVFGESQQKLDVLADEILRHCLARTPAVAVLASEEAEAAIPVRSAEEGGRYCVCFDPLDGSSNVDVAVSVGTIFGVIPLADGLDPTASLLQPGVRQVAAGYVLYGSSVLLVMAIGSGVDLFVLDPALGDFVHVGEKLRIPQEKKIYSLNEGYFEDLPAPYQRYLEGAHRSGYSGRYIGSMVADVHRTLLKGGVFLYPPTQKNPEGKLRLLYEANPMAFVIERAGGLAAAGTGRILEVEPRDIHQRIPVLLGSPVEVERVTRELERA